MNPELVSFQYATGMWLLLENVGGSEQNRSVANVQSDDLWPSRMHAAIQPDIALHGNPFQSYEESLAIWDYTVLPPTRHKWTRPAITPARQAGTRFTYPGGMEGWVDLGSPIAAWRGVENTTARSQVRRPTITPPSNPLDYSIYIWL